MKHTSFLHLILFYLLLEKNYGRYMQLPPIFNYPLLRNMLRNWLLLSKAKKRDSESHKKNETHVRFILCQVPTYQAKLVLCPWYYHWQKSTSFRTCNSYTSFIKPFFYCTSNATLSIYYFYSYFYSFWILFIIFSCIFMHSSHSKIQ